MKINELVTTISATINVRPEIVKKVVGEMVDHLKKDITKEERVKI